MKPKYVEVSETTPLQLGDDNAPAYPDWLYKNNLVVHEAELTYRVARLIAFEVYRTIETTKQHIAKLREAAMRGTSIDTTPTIIKNPMTLPQSSQGRLFYTVLTELFFFFLHLDKKLTSQKITEKDLEKVGAEAANVVGVVRNLMCHPCSAVSIDGNAEKRLGDAIKSRSLTPSELAEIEQNITYTPTLAQVVEWTRIIMFVNERLGYTAVEGFRKEDALERSLVGRR